MREIFAQEWQLCFSRHWEGVGRFRASVYLHAGLPEMAIRLCETVVRGREDWLAARHRRVGAAAQRTGPDHRRDRQRQDDDDQLHGRLINRSGGARS